MPDSSAKTFDVTLGKKPRARDPNLMSAGGKAPNPAAAPLTEGPNRYTIRVPSHSTKLSLGQGDAAETATRNKQIGVGTESGIVGQTDVHTHYHTFGTADPEAKTLVRLGIPPVSVPPTTTYDAGAQTGIGCLLPDSYAVWKGYSMVTQGASYQESRENHVIVSSEGEVRVVADTVLSLTSPGDVLMGANFYTTSKALAQNQHSSALPSDFGNPDLLLRIQQIAPLIVNAGDLFTSAISMVRGVWDGFPVSPKSGMQTWMPADGWTIAGTLAGIAGWALQTTALAAQTALLLMPSAPRGRTSIFASSSATMSGLETASVFSGGATSITGGVSASVLGGVFASLTGLVSASVGAINAKLAGQWSATVDSLWGGTDVKSISDVKVYSTLKSACVTGQTSAQLSSVLGPTYVYGTTGVTLSAAGTMGLLATPASVWMGAVIGPILSATVSNPTNGILVNPAAITLTMTSTIAELTPAATTVTSATVNVNGTAAVNVVSPMTKISGGMVFLG